MWKAWKLTGTAISGCRRIPSSNCWEKALSEKCVQCSRECLECSAVSLTRGFALQVFEYERNADGTKVAVKQVK